MTHRSNIWILAWLGAIGWIAGAMPPAAPAQVAVVAHASVPADRIDRRELLRLYSGDVDEWENGMPVVIVDLAAKGAVRESFYAYLGKTSSRMRSVWLKRKLTGEGELPRSIESEAGILEVVGKTAGAIGFVSEHLAREHPEVKVILSSIPVIE